MVASAQVADQVGRRTFLVGTAATVGAVALCPVSSLGQAALIGPTVRWIQGPRITVDPVAQNDTARHLFEALVALRGPDYKTLEGALATSWRLIDPTTWEFQLRQGVTFHDGRPFTSADVVFSVPRYKSGSAQARLTTLAGIEPAGPHAVIVKTTRPDLSLPHSLTNGLIMSRSWAEEHGVGPTIVASQATYADTHANGTGPYRLETFTPDRWTLVRNTNWWRAADFPRAVERIELRSIPDVAAREAAILEGTADVVFDAPPKVLDNIQTARGMRLERAPELFTTYVALNQVDDVLPVSKSLNPFRDRRVRQALYQATNIDSIVDKVMKGFARPAGMLIEAPTTGFKESLDRRLVHDPKAAQALLSAAGYGGFKATLSAASDGGANHHDIAGPLAEQFKAASLDIAVELIPGAELNRRIAARQVDMYLQTRSAGQTPDGLPLMTILYGRDAPYRNGRILELLDAIPPELVTYTREGMIEEAWRLAVDDIAYLPLHHRDKAVLLSERTRLPNLVYPYLWMPA